MKSYENKQNVTEVKLKTLNISLGEVGDSAAAPLEKVEVNGSGLPDSKQLTKLAILGMSPS